MVIYNGFVIACCGEADLRENLEAKLDILEAQGVTVIDRRQTYLDEAVDVSRVCRGAVLYPGTRLVGAQTFVGPGAKVGIEGPAVLENSIIGENAEVASGYLKEAVMLRNARVGSNAHIRRRNAIGGRSIYRACRWP